MILLYDQLLELCDSTKAFFYKDVEWHGAKFRVFSYRSPTFQEFCRGGALECRGIMYEIDATARPVRVACRPMEKFFNLGENPLTLNPDLSKLDRVMTKVDGSLISSFAHNDRLHLKSKTSLSSVQAMDAQDWLGKRENGEFYRAVYELTMSGHTVNMEWTAPHNRIVLGYKQEMLTVLNVRHNSTGNYLKIKEAWTRHPVLKAFWVAGTCVDRLTDDERTQFYPESVKQMEQIEGFVYVMESGQMIKVKTDWYMNIHRAKDAAMNFRAVLEAVLRDRSDDLRHVLREVDPLALALLDRVELKVKPWLNDVMARVDGFYEANRFLDRKSYAIKATRECPDIHPLIMSVYSGREPAYADFAMKRYDFFKALCGVEGFEGLTEECG